MQNASQALLDSSYSYEERRFDSLNVDDFTTAPLRAIAKAHFKAAPDRVFAKFADHEGMSQWVPMVKHGVRIDHASSKTPHRCDAGSVRVCNFGGDVLTETIKHWDAGKCYAYSVKPDKNSPAVDHLGVVTIESDGKGGSVVSWRQYFNPKPWSMKAKMMPFMMRFVLGKALKNLAKEFGGGVIK